MSDKVKAVREFLKGKKAYFFAGIGVATAAVAWSEGGLSNTEFVAAIFAAIQAVLLRAGMENAAAKRNK